MNKNLFTLNLFEVQVSNRLTVNVLSVNVGRIIVAMVIAFESLISWMPMYGEIKLAFFVYLWYPKTKVTKYTVSEL
jgi:hypothetical protein